MSNLLFILLNKSGSKKFFQYSPYPQYRRKNTCQITRSPNIYRFLCRYFRYPRRHNTEECYTMHTGQRLLHRIAGTVSKLATAIVSGIPEEKLLFRPMRGSFLHGFEHKALRSAGKENHSIPPGFLKNKQNLSGEKGKQKPVRPN